MLNYFGCQGKVGGGGGGGVKDFFGEENYVICRGATDLNKIDELFNFYNNFISVNSSQLYLRQSKKWEANRYTKVGGVSNGLLQPHSYAQGINGEFSDKILKVLSGERIQEALCEISGIDTYSLAQTMFLDHKTTRPHQDWIYLDSIPNGYLIAAWVALEDIFEEGIRFFVYPGTQNHIPESKYREQAEGTDVFNDFLEEIDRLIESNQYTVYAPPIKKGDIFFWGSKIIHGSLAGSNDSLRRRSLAAHFLPKDYEFGNLSGQIPAKFAQKYGLRFRVLDYLDDEFNKRNTAKWRKLRLFGTPSRIGEILRTVFSYSSRRR